MLTFVEDENFAKVSDRLLTETERFELMRKLAKSPDAGDVIPGSGGCRKLRFAANGKGSRGGARVIYLYRPQIGQIRLLEIYVKGEKKDLSATELKILKQRVKS
jgi:hypothetical protein